MSKKTSTKFNPMHALTLVAGAVGGAFAINKSAGMIADPKVRAALPLGIGLFLTTMKDKNIQGVGSGMIAIGGQRLVGAFVPALAGTDSDDVIEGVFDEIDIEGLNDTLNGGDDVLNGYIDEEMNGYEGDY